jgi:hypothetical protein|tara:strand:- start:439 stop:870 length:432 start_codon:yes stop_codon:yes gene_type:complete
MTCTEEAEILFRKIANNFKLEVLKQEDDSIELSMILPIQPGLKSEIWVCLQNIDELWFVVENITCSMFPFKEVKDDFEEVLSGLLSGKYRLVIWTNEKCDLPFRGKIQCPTDDGWKDIHSYESLLSRPLFFKGPVRKKELHIA